MTFISNLSENRPLKEEEKTQSLRLEEKILKNDEIVRNKLGLTNLKHIDFYNLKGFRKLKTFVIFKRSEDRDRILKQFQTVRKYIDQLTIEPK